MAAVGARQLINLVGVSPPVNIQKALLNQAVVPDRVELGCQEDSQQAADVHVRDLEGLGKGHHLAVPGGSAGSRTKYGEFLTELRRGEVGEGVTQSAREG